MNRISKNEKHEKKYEKPETRDFFLEIEKQVTRVYKS